MLFRSTWPDCVTIHYGKYASWLKQPTSVRHTSLAVNLSWGVCGDMVGVGWLEDGEEVVEEEWLCCKRSGKRWMRPAKPLLSSGLARFLSTVLCRKNRHTCLVQVLLKYILSVEKFKRWTTITDCGGGSYSCLVTSCLEATVRVKGFIFLNAIVFQPCIFWQGLPFCQKFWYSNYHGWHLEDPQGYPWPNCWATKYEVGCLIYKLCIFWSKS